MKRALLFTLGLYSGSLQAGGWVDDWFDNSTSGYGGSYETQKRGYYSAGSYSGRWRMSNDYAMSATPPRIEVGCGGIDMFGGGFTYLDPEYMVEKFERIIQAAPAFAFELALTEYCKDCRTVMDTLTSITDQLNSIQVNDCQLSQMTGRFLAEKTKAAYDSWQGEAAAKNSLSTDQRKNKQDFAEAVESGGGRAPDDTRTAIDACPQILKDIYTNGSVVANSAQLVGLQGYADVMRGLLGDVIVSFDADANLYKTEVVESCKGNDTISPRDFIDGQFEKKNTNDKCESAGLTAMTTVVGDTLDSIATKMEAGTALTADETAFINRSPIPIQNALRDAIAAGTVDETINAYTPILSMVFAHKTLDDLYKATLIAIEQASEAARDLKADPAKDAQQCDKAFLITAMEEVENIRDRALTFRSMANASYIREMQELNANLAIAKTFYEQRKILLRNVKGQSQ